MRNKLRKATERPRPAVRELKLEELVQVIGGSGGTPPAPLPPDPC
jgi:hypothetical protein